MGWIADLLLEIPSAARYKIQLEQMAAENAQLKTKIEICESKLLAAQEIIRHQNETIKQQSTDSHDMSSKEIEQRIILHLRNNPESTIKRISTSTGISVKKVSEFLSTSQIFGGVTCHIESPNSDSLWSLK